MGQQARQAPLAASLPTEVVAHIVLLGARHAGTNVAASPRDVAAMCGVCKSWHQGIKENAYLWKELLAQRCPQHPLGSGPAAAELSEDFKAYQDAYKKEILADALLAERPVNNIQIPITMLAENYAQVQRIRLSSVCMSGGRLLALRGGRLVVVSVFEDGNIVQQTLPNARTDRLTGILICDWAHESASLWNGNGAVSSSTRSRGMDGNHKWPFAVATASNAWAARRNSIVEVWSVDSPDPQETGSLVASFSQDAAVMSLAVTQSLILPDVILVCFAVKCARGSRLSLRILAREGGVICQRHIPVVDHTVCALGWSCNPGSGEHLLIAGTTKGFVMVWNIAPGRPREAAAVPSTSEPALKTYAGYCNVTVTGPSQPELMPRLRAVWSIRTQAPGREGVLIVGEAASAVSGCSVICTPVLAPRGRVQDSTWTVLRIQQAGVSMQAKDTSWVGENPAVIYSDGSIRLFRPRTGRCLGVVFKPVRRRYLERGQVMQAGCTMSWPVTLLSLAQEGNSLTILLHTPLKLERVHPVMCPLCGRACRETVLSLEDEASGIAAENANSNVTAIEQQDAARSWNNTYQRQGGFDSTSTPMAENPCAAENGAESHRNSRRRYVFECSCGHQEDRLSAMQMLCTPNAFLAPP